MLKLCRQEYVGMTADGEILCEGNVNTDLDYHLASFRAFVSGKHPIPLVLNKETMRVICKEWNRQFRGARKCYCKPYRVRFSLEVIESSRKSRSKKRNSVASGAEQDWEVCHV